MSFPRSPLQASTWRQTIPKVPFRFSRLSSTLSSLINIHDIPAAHRGCIRVLSLNNPRSRNAISRSLLADLARNVESIHNESSDGLTRALIIASDVDEAFCAGADLKERSTFTLEEYCLLVIQHRTLLTSSNAQNKGLPNESPLDFHLHLSVAHSDHRRHLVACARRWS